jgi:phosphatidylserine/phosphatidylglycerophosphate/cardiolipin synthase-like enzyme
MRTAERSFGSHLAFGEFALIFDIASPLLDSLRQLDSVQRRQSMGTPESVTKLASELVSHVQREPTELAADLYQSFLQTATRIDRVSLAVTGLAWLGAGVPSVQQEMISIIRSAKRELTLCSYSITAGAGTLIDEIADVASQGVLVTVIVNGLRKQPADIRTRIRKWLDTPSVKLRVFDFDLPPVFSPGIVRLSPSFGFRA